MIDRVLADAVLVLHLAFIAFVVLGGFVVLRRPRLAWLHLPAAAWGAATEFLGIICPLTPLENRLRAQGGEAGYGGGFIEHYLTALIYPGWLTREVQSLLGALVIAINVAVYLRLGSGACALRGSKGDAPLYPSVLREKGNVPFRAPARRRRRSPDRRARRARCRAG